ncbi:amidase family protein [Pseudoduganella umbonata]|nr:amidase family protein [Pseudoduganella umbonata]MBB3224939.1 amidase [Pseudoduganella umbonata]
MLELTDAFALGLLDAHDQAALVRNGELDAATLAEAALMRIAALDPALRAASHVASELATARAARLPGGGAMRGVPWMPKDSLDYPGMPSRACSRSRTGMLAAAGHPFVDRLDAAGLVAVGKTSMPEFGLLGSTEPLAGPVTRNPWSARHSPGGSSGGAGAAVAAGLVPLAHGSDGAGSIRLPASCCGVVGLKPGRDATVRVRSRHNVEDLLVGDSLMSRSVRDTAWAFAATHLQPRRPMVTGPSARRLRIAVIENGLQGGAPHADVADVVRRTADLCATLGHRVEAAAWPLDGAAFLQSFQDLWTHLGADCVDTVRAGSGVRRLEDALEPWTLALGSRAEMLSPAALEAAYRQLAGLPARLADFFTRHDVLLSPVASTPPPLLGTFAPTVPAATLMETMFDWIAYTPLQNLAGTPAISLPLFAASDSDAPGGGLPVGSMFSADRGQEDMLLALAYELENAQPWHARWPAVSVATRSRQA